MSVSHCTAFRAFCGSSLPKGRKKCEKKNKRREGVKKRNEKMLKYFNLNTTKGIYFRSFLIRFPGNGTKFRIVIAFKEKKNAREFNTSPKTHTTTKLNEDTNKKETEK